VSSQTGHGYEDLMNMPVSRRYRLAARIGKVVEERAALGNFSGKGVK